MKMDDAGDPELPPPGCWLPRGHPPARNRLGALRAKQTTCCVFPPPREGSCGHWNANRGSDARDDAKRGTPYRRLGRRPSRRCRRDKGLICAFVQQPTRPALKQRRPLTSPSAGLPRSGRLNYSRRQRMEIATGEPPSARLAARERCRSSGGSLSPFVDNFNWLREMTGFPPDTPPDKRHNGGRLAARLRRPAPLGTR